MSSAETTGQRMLVRAQSSFDPTLRLAKLKESESKAYEGAGRNIFSTDPEIHATEEAGPVEIVRGDSKPSPVKDEHAASPLRLRVFGFAMEKNHPRRIFLADEDSIFIAKEGEIVDRRYQILKVEENSVVLKDLIRPAVHTLRFPDRVD